MSYEQSIGERLKELRKLKKITQDDIADMLNVKRQTYSAYERGVSIPDAITLKKLAQYLDVTTDYLLGMPNSNASQQDLIIPDILQGAKIAAHGGEKNWTQDEINKVAEFAEFVINKRKEG